MRPTLKRDVTVSIADFGSARQGSNPCASANAETRYSVFDICEHRADGLIASLPTNSRSDAPISLLAYTSGRFMTNCRCSLRPLFATACEAVFLGE